MFLLRTFIVYLPLERACSCDLSLMSVGQCYTNSEWRLNALGHPCCGLTQRLLWEAGMQHRQSWCVHVPSELYKTCKLFAHTLIDLPSLRDYEDFFTIARLFTTVVNITLLQNMSGNLRY